jgi:uncharacterized membrane protein YdbT with pleckstrin-like domain
MAHSFHPNPVMPSVKILICLAVLTVLLVLGSDFLGGMFLQLLAATWLAAAVLVLFAFILSKFQTITLDDNTITYTGGVFATRRVTLPYARITETSYVQGLLERMLGFGTVSIDTAGGSAVAIHMGNVRYADIKLLLKEINAKTGKGAGI